MDLYSLMILGELHEAKNRSSSWPLHQSVKRTLLRSGNKFTHGVGLLLLQTGDVVVMVVAAAIGDPSVNSTPFVRANCLEVRVAKAAGASGPVVRNHAKIWSLLQHCRFTNLIRTIAAFFFGSTRLIKPITKEFLWSIIYVFKSHSWMHNIFTTIQLILRWLVATYG